MIPSTLAAIKASFMNADYGLCLTDPEGVVVCANWMWLNGNRFAEEQVLGRKLSELQPQAADEIERLHAEVRRSGGSAVGAAYVERTETREVFRQRRYTPVPFGDDFGVLVTVDNVTATAQTKRALHASEARFNLVLDGMLEGCQLIGRDWRYLYLNDAVTKHARKTAEEMLGRTMMEVYPGIESTPLFRTLERCMADGTAARLENEFRYADGTVAWFELSIQPQADGLFVLSTDVTERRRAEEDLRRNEESLREAQRIAGVGSWELRFAPSPTRRWSEEMFRIFARDPALGAASFTELRVACPSDDWCRVDKEASRAREHGGGYEVDVHFRHADGSLHWTIIRGEAIVEGGAIVGLRGTVQDVSARMRAEESFRAVKEQLEAIVQASPVPVVACDERGQVLLWNPAAQTTFGWAEDEVLGRPLPFISEHKRTEHEMLRLRAIGGQRVRNLITTRERRDGATVPVSISTSPLRGPSGAICGTVAVLIDLTEERALREALQASEQRFSAAFDASPMAKLLVRVADRRVVEVNRAYLALAGAPRDKVLGCDIEKLAVFPAPREAWRAVVHAHVRDVDFEFAAHDGSKGEGVASMERLRLHDEDYILVVIQDVTERRRAARALEESDERFRQLAETIEEVFWLTDIAKGEVIYVSPGYEAVWGRPREALRIDARDWIEAIHPDDRERILHAALTKQVLGTYDEEYRIVRPDGAIRWIRDRAFPVKDASGKPFRIAGTSQDVTERRELEGQLHQTQKMESIGLLAGGIAHDFNNLLTVIASSCAALNEVVPKAGDGPEIVREIDAACERATGLTRQLLAFSRREVISPRVVDVDALVVDAERLLQRLLGEDVALRLSLAHEGLRAMLDPGSWLQVLMNLAVNARDAMPRGGKLTIETRSLVLDDAITRVHPELAPGRYAMLSVTDSGRGMPPAIAARIFEPFFTTKPMGRGTGLGLSVVHGIVSQSGGAIEVTSEEGVGTTFRIYVPLCEAPPQSESVIAKRADASGSETILVVEDEESIRRIVVRVLQKAGYSVLQAKDGAHALSLATTHGGPIDLLLTDVVMPEMDGRALAEALRAERAQMRVLYTSGYTGDAVMRYGIKHAEVAFLAKPYGPTALRQKVRDVLDGGP